ncbi:MAG: ATP-dependent DNA helicase RecG, partial [Deltaproteobacteria bacterium]|nr:ATP-dependent DNA helicase RecG [Deltaproteobacteria bacterium]
EGALGPLVHDGKYVTHRFDDALVDAAARFVRRWQPQPPPEWITAIPDRHPNGLVVTLARAIAGRLDLPYVEAVRRTGDGPQQKTMENSHMQATNALRSFSIGDVRPGPVLLIDDIVDSRWTMTVVGNLMLQRGSGPVIPFALASAGTT